MDRKRPRSCSQSWSPGPQAALRDPASRRRARPASRRAAPPPEESIDTGPREASNDDRPGGGSPAGIDLRAPGRRLGLRTRCDAATGPQCMSRTKEDSMAAPKRRDLSKLEKSFVRGRITRRDFIAGASALGLSAGAAIALMSETLHAATPKRGGRLIMGYSAGTSTETWSRPRDHRHRRQPLVGRLQRPRPGHPQPGGGADARGVLGDQAGREVVDLQAARGGGVHIGKTLDAEDVIDSLSRHLGEDSSRRPSRSSRTSVGHEGGRQSTASTSPWRRATRCCR